MAAKKEYGLYVVRPEDIEAKETRYLITPDYCLLYTQSKPPAKSVKVKSLDRLPPLAWEWLKEQVDSVRREYIAQNEAEILAQAKSFFDVFRTELEAERQRILKEGDSDAAKSQNA